MYILGLKYFKQVFKPRDEYWKAYLGNGSQIGFEWELHANSKIFGKENGAGDGTVKEYKYTS